MPEDNKNGLTTTPKDTDKSVAKAPAGKKFGMPKLHQRLAEAQRDVDPLNVDLSKFKHRVVLQLDCSGSMGWTEEHGRVKIDLLKEAIQGFVSACDFGETAVGVDTFPEQISRPLTNIGHLIIMDTAGLRAGGGTPMARGMERVLGGHSMTRSVLISDGASDDDSGCIQQAHRYASAEIPVDTVSIGAHAGGEEVLREIARITGGIYIKFTDIQAFANNFKYLTPRYRAMLATGQIDARTLGAAEVTK